MNIDFVSQKDEWSNELAMFEDNVLAQILKRFYCSKGARFDDFTALDKYRDDGRYRWRLIYSVMKGDRLGRLHAKLIHVICVMMGVEQSARLFSRFIHSARDDKELGNFLAFALTVVPHLAQVRDYDSPSVMTMAVKFAIFETNEIREERAKYVDQIVENYKKVPLLSNLIMLIKWQEQTLPGKDLKHAGILLADLKGELHEGILNWALNYTDMICKSDKGVLNQTSANILDTFFTLVFSLMPQMQLSLSHQNNLLTKICALIVSMLKLVDKNNWGTPLDGVDYFCRLFALAGRIFVKQTGATQTQFLGMLVDEIFGSYDELFVCQNNKDTTRLFTCNRNREFGARFGYNKFRILDFNDDTAQQSIFKEIRQISMEEKSAAAVAHSGNLSRKRPLRAAKGLTNTVIDQFEPEQVRHLLILDVVENLCLATPKSLSVSRNGVYDMEMCRSLGQLLVDHFAGDGLTSNFAWLDWNQERELVAQYIEVIKQIDLHPISFDMMLLLSDSGFQGICFSLPLFKSLFVSTLVQLENTLLKAERLSPVHLQRCNQIFSLLISADFFPKIMETCIELVPLVSNYEAFVLLRDLWDFLRSIIMSTAWSAQGSHIRVTTDQFSLKKKEGGQLISSLVNIIQRNITKLGHFLPPLIEIEGFEAQDQKDWSIGRISRPISTTAEIKR